MKFNVIFPPAPFLHNHFSITGILMVSAAFGVQLVIHCWIQDVITNESAVVRLCMKR
jgi:hypothetical protein